MSKTSNAIDTLPTAVLAHLRVLGENLSIARKRRRESLKTWAQRIGVSQPTLMRMEKGDPSVSRVRFKLMWRYSLSIHPTMEARHD